jgi:hypothetical protein
MLSKYLWLVYDDKMIGHALKVGEKTNAWKFWARKPEMKILLKNLDVDTGKRIILK